MSEAERAGEGPASGHTWAIVCYSIAGVLALCGTGIVVAHQRAARPDRINTVILMRAIGECHVCPGP